ncbi:hypothetical protein [Longimicrobium sp.]|uniref:hypothetical protein n=1 Tax=Longimicrobium sp. TaxID=2029185 RepID=UPI002E352303|nr:hypothetical protein [Longimicrobium sp.]HEX6040142.1 hypothetical protein [Longimicrobium sp.]
MRILAAMAALAAVAPESAWAARLEDAHRDAAVALAPEGVLQQGRGNGGGGGQDDGGGRGRGGGGESRGGRGGRDDAPRTERRQGGGGSSERQSGRGGGSDRAERGNGRAWSSSSSSSSRGNGASGRTEERRGSESSSSRGNASSSSSSSRTERGNGSVSASSRSDERGRASETVRAGGTTVTTSASVENRGARSARGNRRDRLTGQALQARIADLPPDVRQMAESSRPGERVVAGALARGRARNNAGAWDVRSDNGRVRVLSRTGALLFDMDDQRARDLGAWRLRRLGDRQPTGNAPAFCRSGAGHPVFGREWCLDRGFGLGSRTGTVWSRGGIDDVIWRRRTDDRLDRDGLDGVLGDIILGRLALQALSLGYDQPLAGTWVAQPDGPRLLRVSSGGYEVAELVDTDRDDRVDVLYVVQPVW